MIWPPWRAIIQTRPWKVAGAGPIWTKLSRPACSISSSCTDLSLLDVVPQAHIDLDRLPKDRQRRVYDAFHLELRYNDLTSELDIRVTITGDSAAALAVTYNRRTTMPPILPTSPQKASSPPVRAVLARYAPGDPGLTQPNAARRQYRHGTLIAYSAWAGRSVDM
jgi:hypothetical protein